MDERDLRGLDSVSDSTRRTLINQQLWALLQCGANAQRVIDDVPDDEREKKMFCRTAVICAEAAKRLQEKYDYVQVKGEWNDGERKMGAIRVRAPIKVKVNGYTEIDRPTIIIDLFRNRVEANLSPHHSFGYDVASLFSFREYDDMYHAFFQVLLNIGADLSQKRNQRLELEAIEKCLQRRIHGSPYDRFSTEMWPDLINMASGASRVRELKQGYQPPKKDHWWVSASMHDGVPTSMKVFNAKYVKVAQPFKQDKSFWLWTMDQQHPDQVEIMSVNFSGKSVVYGLDFLPGFYFPHQEAAVNGASSDLRLFQIPGETVDRIRKYTTPIHQLKKF